MTSSPPHPVIIIGAGISGLAGAFELHRRGIRSIVLEATDRAGGLILTERDGPFLLDAGPDSILAAKRGGIALCGALGLGERLLPTSGPRTSFVLRAGRLHPFPRPAVLGLPLTWRAAAGASMLSPAGRARAALEPFVPARAAADESISAFIGRRFGREAVEYIAEPLLAGIHAGDVDRLSVHALFPSLPDAERARGSVVRGLRATVPARARDALFLTLPGGMGELIAALSAALPAGTIRFASRVAAVEAYDRTRGDDPHFRVSLDQPGAAPLLARAVVVAAPAWAAAKMLAGLDARLAALSAEIPYTSSAVVALAYDRAAVGDPLAGSGVVVPRAERSPLLAATWISSKWPGRAPADSVLLRAFLGGARDAAAVDRSDEDLVETAVRALSPLARLAGRPRLARVYRWRQASAQHEVGHLSRLAAIEQRLAAWPGLFLTGSGFRVTGIPDCIADAMSVAGQVSGLHSKTL